LGSPKEPGDKDKVENESDVVPALGELDQVERRPSAKVTGTSCYGSNVLYPRGSHKYPNVAALRGDRASAGGSHLYPQLLGRLRSGGLSLEASPHREFLRPPSQLIA
jgi:hypothetical protein